MHKSFWFKIHWFLGIVFGLTLIVIGVSGAVLSYEKEILRFINKDTYFVEVPQDKAKLSAQELLTIYQEQNSKARINSITISSNATSSASINIASQDPKDRRGITEYLNPYTAEVLPQIVGKDFFMFFFTLHRWLTLEGDYRSIGKNIVAISTIACILLVIGGIVVYFPRIKNHFFKSFTFSFKHKNRAFLSTMHSAIGLWVTPFFLLVCLTGLYWSYDWYRSAMFKVFNVEQPVRNNQAQPKQNEYKPNFENIQKVVDIFNQNVTKDYKSATIRLNGSKDNIYTVSYLFEDATHYRETNSMEINLNSLKVEKSVIFKDKPLNEQIMSSMLPLHSGEFFGWIGQLGMFLSSSLMALFVITGYMLYFKRRKSKKEKALKLRA